MAQAADHEDWTGPRFGSAGGTMSPVVAQTRALIALTMSLPYSAVCPGSDLGGDLEMGEQDRIDLALSLRQRFGIEISDAETEGWVTAGDVAALVRDRFMKRVIP